MAVGRVRLAGRLEGFAFVLRREPLAAAVAALQADLVNSLRHRLEVRWTRLAGLHQCINMTAAFLLAPTSVLSADVVIMRTHLCSLPLFQQVLRPVQLVEEDAEAAEEGLDSHPLLARPSAIAIVAPALPARVFVATQVGNKGSFFSQPIAHAASLYGDALPRHLQADWLCCSNLTRES